MVVSFFTADLALREAFRRMRVRSREPHPGPPERRRQTTTAFLSILEQGENRFLSDEGVFYK